MTELGGMTETWTRMAGMTGIEILTGVRRAMIGPETQTGTGIGTMTDLATGMSESGTEAEKEAESA